MLASCWERRAKSASGKIVKYLLVQLGRFKSGKGHEILSLRLEVHVQNPRIRCDESFNVHKMRRESPVDYQNSTIDIPIHVP
jgi:hypothetical protein